MAENHEKDLWAAGRLGPAQLDAVLARLEGVPTSPLAASALLELLDRCLPAHSAEAAAKAESDPSDRGRLKPQITEIVRRDPVLTARVLALAGRSSAPVATVEHAVGKLDVETLCGEAVTLAVWPEEADSPRRDVLPRRELWRHCQAVACAARMIAEHLVEAVDPSEAFAAGLLHDLGKLAMDACMPKSLRRAAELAAAAGGDIAPYERQVIGADHTTVGRRLAELWRLPPTVAEAIWLHHQPTDALPQAVASVAMIRVVALADAIAREANLGLSGSYGRPPNCDELTRQLGLSAEELAEVRGRLADELHACEAPLEGDEAAARAVYARSLRSLAAKLAGANAALRAGSGELAARAQAFAQLHDFAGSLGEQSTVPDALGQIARLLAKTGGLPTGSDEPVVAYSVGQAGESTQLVRFDGEELTWRDLPAAQDSPTADPAAMTAAAVAEMLGPAELGEWLDVSVCLHLPLLCAGRWVGGVLYGPPQSPAASQQVLQAAASAAAMVLAIVQGRCRAVVLGEELAAASQALAAGQEAAAEASTSSAIGELAAGAAHELNNPLAVISGRAQLMRDKAGGDEERKVWSLIVDQAQRISDTITELMDFASPPPPQPRRIDVGELLKLAANSFSSSSHPKAATAQVDIDVRSNTPPAWADESQIRAVIMEAISNAATAATDRPHIRMSARAGEQPGTVLIAVADDGPGMDVQTLQRVFTPFFSVQRAGRRKGLGLPRARRYVENNAGKIHLTSQPGQGTTVLIQLPQG